MILMKKFAFIFLGLFLTTLAGFAVAFLVREGKPQDFLAEAKKSCAPQVRNIYVAEKDFFEKAYEKVPTHNLSREKIKGIFVNHHLLVPELVAESLQSVATEKPVTVLLVAPNHFSAGKGLITSSLYGWQAPYGILESDCDSISKLEKENAFVVDEFPFKKEHAIFGIVPFIKKSLPNAKIIPIIVRDNAPDEYVDRAVTKIKAQLPSDTIVIGSFDFSHYLPSQHADFHDDKALSVIRNFDYDGAKMLDIDSIPGLRFVMKYMESSGAKHFNLFTHTNSAKVLQNSTLQETTSYITGAFTLGEKVADESVTILAFGDMMLDRLVRNQIDAHGKYYPFQNIQRFLKGSDIVVANAEGVFTDFPSRTAGSDHSILNFTFEKNMLPTLKKLGFTTFSQANNHTLDFGYAGLTQSLDAISQAGFKAFGRPDNREPGPVYETIRGKKIAFVGYHQFGEQNMDLVLRAIIDAKQAGAFTIVYPHWGVEYSTYQVSLQEKLAHEFIDAGADVVLGSHPHVIEPIEIYKGKAIFYSLGNFVFDQDFSEATKEGLSVGITLTPEKVKYYLFPFEIRYGQVSLASNTVRAKILSNLQKRSTVSDELKKEIGEGLFTLLR